MINEFFKFLLNPWMWGLTIICWSLAIASIVYWRQNRNSYLVYAYLFLLFTPLFFFARALECSMGLSGGLLEWCTLAVSKLIIYAIPVSILIAFISGYYIMPQMYKRYFAKKEIKSGFVKKYSEQINVYLTDKAKPVAFSIRSNIFVSVGMFELLTRKQLEAVLLHEIGHIVNKSSWNNISTKILQFASPLSSFNITEHKLNDEEILADEFAVIEQKTTRYLFSAKKIVKEYYDEC